MPGLEASVVLPVRNAASTLGEQLAALATQDFTGAWEVIVVDNGSTDGTRAVIDAWSSRLPNFRLVAQPDGGYARACNTAVESASAPRILFCESDDVVAPGWVRAMVEALHHHDLVGGALEYERLNSAVVRASRNPIQSKRLPVLFGFKPYSFGANLGVSRAAFRNVGGFDERFSGGSADSDLCWRVQLQGAPIDFAPDAVVHYRLRDSLSGLLKQQYRYAREDECLYAKFRGLGALTTRPVARYANALSQLLRACLGITALFDQAGRWRLLARFAWVAGRFAGFSKARQAPSFRRRPRGRVMPASAVVGRCRSLGGSPGPD